VPVFVGLIPYRDTGEVYPQTPAGIDGNDANHTLLKYNNAIEVMARRFGFNVIDSMQCGIGPGNIGTYYQDGLHFNTAGGIRYAQFLVDEMNIITPY
jgi:lysophospholipase L1-like esterase